MKILPFAIWFLITVILYFLEGRFLNTAIRIEFQYFLIFYIIKSSETIRAMWMIFVLGMGLDLVLQTNAVKGIGVMSQLLLGFGLVKLKKHVMPHFESFFLIVFFALFAFSNYYLTKGLKLVLGIPVEQQPIQMVLLSTGIHTVIFSFLLLLTKKWGHKRHETR